MEYVVASRPVVETTPVIARKVGRIDGQLRTASEAIDVGDAMIGATGVLGDEPVLTGNPVTSSGFRG